MQNGDNGTLTTEYSLICENGGEIKKIISVNAKSYCKNHDLQRKIF